MAEKLNIDDLIAKEKAALQQDIDEGSLGALKRGAGLATRAAGPTIAGATAGAAMGAPFAGIGAIPGAIAGAAAANLALPISDLFVSGYNYLTGSNQPVPSQAVENIMTASGLPQPATPTERLMQTATRSSLETLTGAKAAKQASQILAPVAPQTTGQRVLGVLAEQPGAQTTAATLGATASQGAEEVGAPSSVSMPLGMLAGSVPYLARPQNLFPKMGSEVYDANVKTLKDFNIPLTPAQELGNVGARLTESAMKFLPTSATTVAKAEDQQMRAFTKKILGFAGIDSDIATPDVLVKARQDFGKRYDALEAKTSLKGDGQLFDDLLSVERNYVDGFPDAVKPGYKKKIDEILNYAAGVKTAEGKTYHRLQSELSEQIAKASASTDPSYSYYREAMTKLQEALANAMERSSPKDMKGQWSKLNKEYAIFSRVEDAMARVGQEKLNTGFIPPRHIASVQRARDTTAYVESRDPFTTLVRAGEALLPDPIPNSGTAPRSFYQDLLTGGKRGGPGLAGLGVAKAAGYSLLDPTLSLGVPYLTSKAWYAKPQSKEFQGLLAAQAARGASEPQ